MQSVTFTNVRGESITFGMSPPFILARIDGTGGPGADIKTTKSPYQDGASYVGTQLDERDISLDVTIKGTSREDMYTQRRWLLRVVNPKLGPGLLVYRNDSRSYAIPAICDTNSPSWGRRFAHNQEFTLAFTCPDPYWRDESQVVKGLKFEDGGLTFPLRLATTFAFSSYRGIFTNDGDVDTPLEIHYKGPAANPVVLNETTGEYIKINYELSATDVLHINTAFGNKRVEVIKSDGSRVNVFHWIDLASTFFQLIPGKNMLRYSSDRETDWQLANVMVYWHNRYYGG